MSMLRFFFFICACSCPGMLQSQNAIIWDDPVGSVPADFGYLNLRMELDAAGHPIILHGKSGTEGGLYCTRFVDGVLTAPVQVTEETGLFINDAEGPRMAVSGNRVAVAYQISGQWADGGRIVISEDGGVTWGDPIPIAPGATEDHFMPIPAFDEDAQPWVAVKWGVNPVLEGVQFWDPAAGAFLPPVDAGAPMDGAAVCECCASMPFTHDGRHYDIVRNNDDNLRDFWVVRTDEEGQWTEALDVDPTNWTINSCPASEAESCVLGDGTLAIVYMSAAEGGTRVYWSTVDLNGWSLTGSDRIQSALDITENNPSIDADGTASVVAWERSQGGYNIYVAHGDGTASAPEQRESSATGLTEDLSGHSRRPVIRMEGSTVHLVYQRPSEGTFHYMQGSLTGTSALDHPTSDVSSPKRLSQGWLLPIADGPFAWTILDMQGRNVASGVATSDLVPFTESGSHVLLVSAPGGERRFRLVR